MLLKDTTKLQEFKIVLLNKFHVLEELLEEETINEKWQAIKESFTSTRKEGLVSKMQHHKEWISVETVKTIEDRNKAEINNSRTRAGKTGAYKEYSHATKIAKKSIKADNMEYMNMLETETEEAAHLENLREQYTNIKKLAGKFGKPERPVKDKGGKPIPDEESQNKRWMEHFGELINRSASQDQIFHQPVMNYQSAVIHPPRRKYTRPSK